MAVNNTDQVCDRCRAIYPTARPRARKGHQPGTCLICEQPLCWGSDSDDDLNLTTELSDDAVKFLEYVQGGLK